MEIESICGCAVAKNKISNTNQKLFQMRMCGSFNNFNVESILNLSSQLYSSKTKISINEKKTDCLRFLHYSQARNIFASKFACKNKLRDFGPVCEHRKQRTYKNAFYLTINVHNLNLLLNWRSGLCPLSVSSLFFYYALDLFAGIFKRHTFILDYISSAYVMYSMDRT